MAAEINKPARPHTLQLDGRKKAVLQGVGEVVSMTETLAQLRTGAGGLTIGGSGMHMTKYNADEGFMVIEGLISKIQYSGGAEDSGGKSGLRKLFK